MPIFDKWKHRNSCASLTLGLAALIFAPSVTQSQTHPLARTSPSQADSSQPHRTRLILKDGTYQVVMRYTVDGNLVRFQSAERGGATEEIPLALVDLEATRRYEQTHAPNQGTEEDQQGRPPAIDPDLIKEEAERASRTPEVAPDLRLDTENAVLLLDTFQGTPELVPLTQSGGDLNRLTGHSVLRGIVNPMASPHEVAQIKGMRSPVQSHVEAPVIFLRIGDDAGAPTGSAPLVVDTHGAKGDTAPSPDRTATSNYVIVRTDVRRDVRKLMSFQIRPRGNTGRQEDVVETKAELLPGGHWMKLTPYDGLGFGEYALVEVLSDREINLGVWDFGVHPTAPENRDVLRPEAQRPATLERRPRN